jgi:hypothetical protein
MPWANTSSSLSNIPIVALTIELLVLIGGGMDEILLTFPPPTPPWAWIYSTSQNMQNPHRTQLQMTRRATKNQREYWMVLNTLKKKFKEN